MSFKYRFIISFVLLEVFFIVLIVTMNFITIANSSEQLIKQKINSNMSFLEQMIRVPISIYDIASLDNLVTNTTKLEYIDSVVVLDKENKVISKAYNFELIKPEDLILIKDSQTISLPDHTYEIRSKQIKEENIELGSLYVIFDTSDNFRFINKSKRNTIYIILVEILISIYLSYFIGNRLTKVLTKLAAVATDIGKSKETEIPFQERKDEIGTLSKSMNKMQIDLNQRRDRLKGFAKELNEQKNELIAANKSKDDFLANMSHELKTPLNSINVISSIMMKNTKKLLNEEQIKNLTIINNCGNDLLFLINDVLDVSKLEAGEIQLLNETLDFESTMEKIKGMFEAQMKAKGVEFIFEYDSNIGYIYSDEQRIKQVVKNLLSNAIKFAQNGTVKLIVKNAQDKVEIIVRDNGIGIPQDKLENIFDRFKQVDESTTRNYGGTGLGLAICKELSQLLGGDVQVKSKENEGTIFKVTIAKNSDKVDLNEKIPNISSIEAPIQSNITTNNTIETKESTENKVESIETKIEDKITPTKTKIETESEDKMASIKNKNGNKVENILVLNNDPVNFIKLTIELKKAHTVIQSNSMNNFLDEYKNNKDIDLAIIDTSLVDKTNLEKIVHKLSIKFILIYEKELDTLEDEKIIQKIKKPFNAEDITCKLTT